MPKHVACLQVLNLHETTPLAPLGFGFEYVWDPFDQVEITWGAFHSRPHTTFLRSLPWTVGPRGLLDDQMLPPIP